MSRDIAKHTPGPWKAHSTGLARSGKPEYEIHWSDDGECVAEVVHGEADARLIAAAPELLEALHVVGMSAGWQYMTMESRRLIEAAIAKAEGRS